MYRLHFRKKGSQEQVCPESTVFTEDKTGSKNVLYGVDIKDQEADCDNTSGDEEVIEVSQMNKLFHVDTSGNKKEAYKNDDDDDDEDIDDTDDDNHAVSDLPAPKFPIIINKTDTKESSSDGNKKEKDIINWDNTYLDIQLDNRKGSYVNEDARRFCKVDEIMKKSVITPGYEKLKNVPAYNESMQALRKKRKKERERTKGSKWYDMPATEMTDEIKHDLEVMQMRSVLDPKHFYKKNDLKILPKYFQVGKVVDNPADFYHSRVPKKQRKRTIVDELLTDAEFQRYNKKRYKEITEERRKTHYKAHIRAKKLKRKK